MTSTMYILENVIEASIENFFSDYYHTDLGEGGSEEDAKKMQETFPR